MNEKLSRGWHNSDIGESFGKMYNPNSVTQYPQRDLGETSGSDKTTKPPLTDRERNAVWMRDNHKPYNSKNLPKNDPDYGG